MFTERALLILEPTEEGRAKRRHKQNEIMRTSVPIMKKKMLKSLVLREMTAKEKEELIGDKGGTPFAKYYQGTTHVLGDIYNISKAEDEAWRKHSTLKSEAEQAI